MMLPIDIERKHSTDIRRGIETQWKAARLTTNGLERMYSFARLSVEAIWRRAVRSQSRKRVVIR